LKPVIETKQQMKSSQSTKINVNKIRPSSSI